MMSKYIKVADQEKIFLKHVNDIGVINHLCTSDGNWNYIELRLANRIRRYWKTKDTKAFISKLNIVDTL